MTKRIIIILSALLGCCAGLQAQNRIASAGVASDSDNPVIVLTSALPVKSEISMDLVITKSVKIDWGTGSAIEYQVKEVEEHGGSISGVLGESQVVKIIAAPDAIAHFGAYNLGLTKVEFLSPMPALKGLALTDNKLKEIDLFMCPALEDLGLSRNMPEKLSLAPLTRLKQLRVDGCGLETLDLSTNKELIYLSVEKNLLTDLCLSGQTALETLQCSKNKITSLDLRSNVCLQNIKASGNELTIADFSTLSSVKKLTIDANKLTDLKVSASAPLAIVDIMDNCMDPCALDAFFKLLPAKAQKGGKDLLIKNNPGSKTSQTKIAIDKNWTADISGDGTGCDYASAEGVVAAEPEVRLRNGKLYITARADKQVFVYDTTGRKVSVCGGEREYELILPSGNYVIRTGKFVQQVIMP